MRYMTLVKSVEGSGLPPPALMEAIAQLGMEAAAAGVLVETGGLMPTSAGATMRLENGRIVITDGPFAEAKEVVGGYAVYEVAAKAEVLEWTRRFLDLHRLHWKGWRGECEIREIMSPPPSPA